MGALLLVGMMNIAWMAILTDVMVAEAFLHSAAIRPSQVVGTVFLGAAVVLLVAPRALPPLV